MKIPRDISGAVLARALRKLGYAVVRQSGSHMVLTSKLAGEHHVTVPNHRPIKVGTLIGILKGIAAQHELTLDELSNLLEL